MTQPALPGLEQAEIPHAPAKRPACKVLTSVRRDLKALATAGLLAGQDTRASMAVQLAARLDHVLEHGSQLDVARITAQLRGVMNELPSPDGAGDATWLTDMSTPVGHTEEPDPTDPGTTLG